MCRCPPEMLLALPLQGCLSVPERLRVIARSGDRVTRDVVRDAIGDARNGTARPPFTS